MTRRIETEDDIAEGCAWLARADAAMGRALDAAGLPPLRRRPHGFTGLLRIVTGQQLSVAAADAVWRRLEAAGLTAPEALADASDAAIRACGLSAAKLRCARALAAAGLDYDKLREAPEAEAVAALTALPGVGPWTAEIYLMFCEGRPDVFAPGDLALQEGARLLCGLDARPAPRALGDMASRWSPWRAVAARALWAYYAHAKGREGVAE
ncbi:MAG: DNA-3-methyladenine glycosylase family protein [Rubrimonas sp.]